MYGIRLESGKCKEYFLKFFFFTVFYNNAFRLGRYTIRFVQQLLENLKISLHFHPVFESTMLKLFSYIFFYTVFFRSFKSRLAYKQDHDISVCVYTV